MVKSNDEFIIVDLLQNDYKFSMGGTKFSLSINNAQTYTSIEDATMYVSLIFFSNKSSIKRKLKIYEKKQYLRKLKIKQLTLL